jgi:hypothetical protein
VAKITLRSRKAGIAARVALTALVAPLLSAGIAGATPAHAINTANPPALWYKLNGHPTDPELVAAAQKCRVVVLHAWETAAARRIKSLNPDVTVLVYKDLSATNSNADTVINGKDLPLLATGVGYAEASQHPEWFATDTAGKRIQWNGYAGLWQMAVWNTAYQQRWVDNVTRELAGSPFDGVFGDDALVTLKWYSSATMPGAPTNAALQAAERALIAKATSGLHGIGKKMVLNIGSATAYPSVWHDWVNLADGGMIEHFVFYGGNENDPGNYQYDWGTDGWTALGGLLNDGDINVVVASASPTQTRAYRFSLASWYLLSGGRGAFQAAAGDDYGRLDVRPEMEWQLGSPVTPMTKVGAAYVRAFQGGFAAANPSSGATVTVPVPAGMVDAAGNAVSSVTLGPLQGAVYRTNGAVPAVQGAWRHYAPKPVKAPATSARAATTTRKVTATRPAATRAAAARPTAARPVAVRAAGRTAAVDATRSAAPSAARPVAVKPATATPTTAYLTPLLPTGLPIAPGTPADAGLALALTVAAFARRRRVPARQAA